jgi:predicted O-methyltransferase YrrM
VDARARGVLDELLRAAEAHDATRADRLQRWRVLEPDAGELLWFLAQTVPAKDIVEIGTSRGASTLWLADAARATGGRVLSLDLDEPAQRDAEALLREAGLADRVEFRCQDGGVALAALPDASVDLLFLDAERTEYPAWWPHPARVLRPGGLLIADNAFSHEKEMAPLRALVASHGALVSTVVAVGKGELLAYRR